MRKLSVVALLSITLGLGCSKDTKTDATNPSPEPTAMKMPDATKPVPFVPDIPTNPLPEDHAIALLAGRIVGLDSGPWGTSDAVMELLSPPTPSSSPPHGGFRTQYWEFETAEGTFELGLTYKDGTWEKPRGNGQPNRHRPEVVAIELTGPGYIDLKAPADAQTMRFNATDGTERQMAVWHDFAYFEQGHQGRPWMVARTVGRGTFHATTEERARMEDVLIELSDAMKKTPDLDLQEYMASHAGDFKTGENLYDFGIGRIEALHPATVTVSWVGPTKLSRFFERYGEPQIMTAFAHDYGDMAKNIELGHMHVRPSDYYIIRPRMHYEEGGSATSAHFRKLHILKPTR